MSDSPSIERQRKRPRSETGNVSPSHLDMTVDSDSDSSGDSSSSAFYGLLVAETAAGNDLAKAVTNLFDSVGLKGRVQNIDLAKPVLTALSTSPDLANDLRTVARMCEAVYQLARDELRPGRQRLELKLGELADVADLVSRANNIVVLTGAGVSVSCGIPDFRSKGGLYDTVLERYGLTDPQAIFDVEEFRMDPRLFYSFAKDVMPSKDLQPSPTHRFVAELEKKGKLLRNYSQNIDGLERRAGVSEERVILCHGSFLTATCMRRTCRATIAGDEIAAEVARGAVPLCRVCGADSDKKPNNDESEDDEDDGGEYDVESMGVLKPDIVFFGENLPKRVSENLEKDVSKADMLLVLGTSLQVAPVARIPQYFAQGVPRILVNRELVSYDFDIELLGNCDAVVAHLRRALGWDTRPTKSNESTREESNSTEGTSEDMGPDASTEVQVQFKPPRRFLFPGALENESDLEDDDDPVD
eukprot:GFKZ01008328.1.p1 GENE.GFKZ01008328.1~~GFKZ01008328.1.p1  ORF type:complete len:472 (+),score=77.96 GFKZ01008328.1:167-1582(+)